jgi:hypothetical protein
MPTFSGTGSFSVAAFIRFSLEKPISQFFELVARPEKTGRTECAEDAGIQSGRLCKNRLWKNQQKALRE